ncbi:hypothetical protein GLOTRDRAFT_137815 [Gloeophyllum trabeum ATCC 11539]|uniref:GmrSD restriction endonucleases N-terminal domain-containing protein n=1 Tax=Gloeophyllum trabeum (strain ATCC 11539 / FP-39264 / Madison 617) TaxID=670483 RepID=S7RW41_GLOTA|nr:uncharacterized protein GLOTRDRAFT_137815 [Gloeophyllum trabeum ATCC 11539]EPQ57499.1 hypothetical protein GLOTRDRAFT_137815 [Gloeophyllum trabeum ATCC 11539]
MQSPSRVSGWNPLEEDDGDVMEVEEDEDEITDDASDFRMPTRLKDPKRRSYTLRELVDMMHRGKIDTDPPYQRSEVWPADRQRGLVDTLMRNYNIPRILISVREDEKKGEIMRILDGKQRLTAIKAFMAGNIACKQKFSRCKISHAKMMFHAGKDPVTSKNWFFTLPKGSNKLKMPAHVQSLLENTEIPCDEYYGLTDEQEHEMFQRVQLGMQLTQGEKLHAISSLRTAYIAEVYDRLVAAPEIDGLKGSPPQGDRLRAYMEFETKRSQPTVNLSHLMYMLEGIRAHERWHPTRQQVQPWLNVDEDFGPELKADLEDALEKMKEIGKDSELNVEAGFTMGRKIAPVEFIFIAVLVHLMRHATPLQRAQAIKGLRLMLSEKHTGQIRMNAMVMRNAWNYIEDKLKGTDDETRVPAAEVKKGKQKPQRDRLEPTTPAQTPNPSPRKKATTREDSLSTLEDEAAELAPSTSKAVARTPVATPRKKTRTTATQGDTPKASAMKREREEADTSTSHDVGESPVRKRLGLATPKRAKPASTNSASSLNSDVHPRDVKPLSKVPGSAAKPLSGPLKKRMRILDSDSDE